MARPVEVCTRNLYRSTQGKEGVTAFTSNQVPRRLVVLLTLAPILAAARPVSGQG